MLSKILAIFALLWLPLAAQADALDSALTALGLARADFRVDEGMLTARPWGELKLPIFEQWFAEPLRVPFYERHLRNSLLESNGGLHALCGGAAGMLGVTTRRDLLPPSPLRSYATRAREPEALKAAIRALDREAQIPSLQALPKAMQEIAAMLLFAEADAIAWRELALRDVPEGERGDLYKLLLEPLERSAADSGKQEDTPPEGLAQYYEQMALLAGIDLKALAAGADDLTAVVDSARQFLLAATAPERFDFVCHTRYGAIRLTTGRDDEYGGGEPYLLLVDLSGNDVYHGGAASDVAHPVSVVIDLFGDDRYEATGNKPAFGAGLLGYGVLVDAGGNDSYACAGFYSAGCGYGGIGLLYDGGGNDTYEGVGGAQGFGRFGIGILADAGGNDTYHAFVCAQGCGMTRGAGLLVDFTGNDVYTADDTEIRFPSPQSNAHNSNLCQGAGFGLRRDYIDGHSLAGGVGLLLDGAGDDQYAGGVFCQAVGYWYGIGVLDDRAGNDRYNAVWYGQSATAHMGLSYLCEGGGDDVYTSTMTMSAGAANDLSASLFVEEGGNDTYLQEANCLGRSLNSSVALFAELAGNDTYAGRDGFGSCRSDFQTGLRAEIPAAAVFLDLGGTDSYSDSTAGNERLWKQASPAPIPALRGVGLDLEEGILVW